MGEREAAQNFYWNTLAFVELWGSIDHLDLSTRSSRSSFRSYPLAISLYKMRVFSILYSYITEISIRTSMTNCLTSRFLREIPVKFYFSLVNLLACRFKEISWVLAGKVWCSMKLLLGKITERKLLVKSYPRKRWGFTKEAKTCNSCTRLVWHPSMMILAAHDSRLRSLSDNVSPSTRQFTWDVTFLHTAGSDTSRSCCNRCTSKILSKAV